MKKGKNLRYYLRIFLLSSIGLISYIIYMSIRNGEFDADLYGNLIFVPVFFVIFTFSFDFIVNLIFGEKEISMNDYNKFVKITGDAIEASGNYDIEDFRKLRESSKFQKALNHAFKIVSEGEYKEVTFEFLEKKFKKGTLEYEAIMIVIAEAKKMKDLS